MIVLGLETSTPSGGVALLGDEGLLGLEVVTSARAHSRLILPAAEKLLRENGLDWGSVDVVAVSRGPGSFTGVRVGLALAKGLCWGGAARLTAVSTLQALALNAWSGEDVVAVVPVLNARLGEVYAAAYLPSGEEILSERACTPEELAQELPEGRLLLAGDGAPLMTGLLGERALVARVDRRLPSPASVALLGRRQAEAGRFDDPVLVAPAYLREARTSQPKKKTTLG